MRWLINRLRTMDASEICARFSDFGRHAMLRASLDHVRKRAEIEVAHAPFKVVPGGSHARLGRVDQTLQTRIMAQANDWLEHKASFFAFHALPLGDSIAWHRDYASGVTGPMSYSAFINPRDARVAGDVKNIWELNRLQHLVLLALAAVWTDDVRYSDEIIVQLRSWHDQNPFMQGLNWKSPLESGIRLISMAFVFWLIGDRADIDSLFRTELRTSLYQHQYMIRRFFAKHSSANNHLVGEMVGLYVASVVWPWYRESSSWQSFARDQLIAEIVNQVYADGVGQEQAMEYQLFIFEFFLLAGALGHVVGDPFPPDYWERLQHMAAFVAMVSDRQGHLPMFGDGDSGQVVWLPETLEERAATVVRLGKADSQGQVKAAPPDVRSTLLLWGQTKEDVPFMPVKMTQQSLRGFSQGGYYVLTAGQTRDDEMIVVFDAGPLGLPSLYAHGHADALSFWLSYGGREFFIDPGTFCYYGKDAWRAYFRGTAAHNTVRVDGQDQSIAGGRFLWRHVAQCQLAYAEDNGTHITVEARHDGYQRLNDPVMHWRRVELDRPGQVITIADPSRLPATTSSRTIFSFQRSM